MRKYLAECIGTFALVFCGTGAIVVDQQTGGAVTHVGVAITFGLIVMAMIYAFGEISGAHLNPAVTLAFAVSKIFPWKESIPFIISQLVGALLASLTIKILFPASVYLGATIPAGPVMQSFVLEILLTFFLMLVICAVAQGSKEQGMYAGMAIGAVVLLEAMFAGPISGASMNPARSIAPAVISGHLENLWIYIFAPITGAISGVAAWQFIRKTA